MTAGSTPPPFRHPEDGEVCPVSATEECTTDIVHHRPRHAEPVPARYGTSPAWYVGKRVGVPVESRRGSSFRHLTTMPRTVTR